MNDRIETGAQSGPRNLSGAVVAADICEEIKADLATLASPPTLAILRIGEQADDVFYEKAIARRFSSLGLGISVRACPADISQEIFLQRIRQANEDPDVQGILIFHPLPAHIDSAAVAECIDPAKDLDGISPQNRAKLYSGDPTGLSPCTALAVIALLDHAGIELAGVRAALVGRSVVVGKPLAMLLLQRDATVTVCHSKTQNLPDVCREAQLLIACAGKAKMLGAQYIRPGATVVDVGVNTDEDGKLCGDVDFAEASGVAGAITPVPGGVGAVTTSILARQLVKAAKARFRSRA